MAEYAYSPSPGKIKFFLDKIQEVGVPQKSTQAWLTSIGFTSTNDRTLISVMRQIGFIDPSSKPTSAWEEFRGGDQHALAQGIRQGYQAFYSTYPDAHRRSSAELENIVKSTAPKLGKEAVSRVLSTFKALVAEAEFSENGVAPPTGVVANSNGAAPTVQPQAGAVVRGSGFTINVNVQLTLPETTDGTVYEKLFAAMRENLLEGLANGS